MYGYTESTNKEIVVFDVAYYKKGSVFRVWDGEASEEMFEHGTFLADGFNIETDMAKATVEEINKQCMPLDSNDVHVVIKKDLLTIRAESYMGENLFSEGGMKNEVEMADVEEVFGEYISTLAEDFKPIALSLIGNADLIFMKIPTIWEHTYMEMDNFNGHDFGSNWDYIGILNWASVSPLKKEEK